MSSEHCADSSTNQRADALRELLQRGRKRLHDSTHIVVTTLDDSDDTWVDEAVVVFRSVLLGCESLSPSKPFADRPYRIRDASAVASALVKAGLVQTGIASRVPLRLNGREVGTLTIDDSELLASLLSTDQVFPCFMDMVNYVQSARLEFDLLVNLGRADGNRLLVRWRAELDSVKWTMDDLEEALREGATACLTFRPVAELVRSLLVGRRPASEIQRIAKALKVASDRSPEPTADQVTWVREREPRVREAIELLGVGDNASDNLKLALKDWFDACDLAEIVQTVERRRLGRRRHAPSRILATLIGQHFKLGRDFGYHVLRALSASE